MIIIPMIIILMIITTLIIQQKEELLREITIKYDSTTTICLVVLNNFALQYVNFGKKEEI